VVKIPKSFHQNFFTGQPNTTLISFPFSFILLPHPSKVRPDGMGSWRPARPMRGGGLQPSSTRDRRALCATAACSLAELLDGALEQASTFSFVFYFLFVELYIIYLFSLFSFIFSVWKKFFYKFFCKSFSFNFFSIFLFCKSFSFNFFSLQNFSWKFFYASKIFFFDFFLTFSPFKFFLRILFLIFLIRKRQKFTQKGKKYNGREIDHRDPLPTVNRKLAVPVLIVDH